MEAICIKNVVDFRWYMARDEFSELEIGKHYTVECSIIGRSWSIICLKEFKGNFYGAGMFDYERDGKSIELIDKVVDALLRISRLTNYNEDDHQNTQVFCYKPLSDETFNAIVKNYGRLPMINYLSNPIEDLKEMIFDRIKE
jgi:hypothetical protein